MPRCYRCGHLFPPEKSTIRRSVQTGQQVVRAFQGVRMVSTKTSFGKRIVCPQCAKAIDRERFLSELLGFKELWLIAGLVALPLILALVNLFR